jgi:multidrug efflux pump subunit AcrB
MSFGSATPVEVAVSGPDLKANIDFARKIREKLAAIPALRDLRILQAVDYPQIRIDVDRERAGALGMTSSQINRSFVAATSSSRYVVPNYWADRKSGVGYQVQVEVPVEKLDSVDQIKNLPVATKDGAEILLRNVATVSQREANEEIDRYNMQRMITLDANISGEDLGRVSVHVRKAIAELGAPPRGVTVAVRGQTAPMDSMLAGLANGFLLAIVVIFLLLTANFQSLRLALTVVSTIPAVATGVVTALWLSGTTVNIQSFMGAIMAIGVAVANAILLITFAERARVGGENSIVAAIHGASSRLRPILMTSAAMIAGMIPMALGLGEGGEQTAPLGRAVVGGLLFATFATLTILPCVYALVMHSASRQAPSLDPHDPESVRFIPEGTMPAKH